MPLCSFCNHQVSWGDVYWYADKDNGIDECHVCWKCLLKHSLKHYPDGSNTKHLLNYYSTEISNDPELQKIIENETE